MKILIFLMMFYKAQAGLSLLARNCLSLIPLSLGPGIIKLTHCLQKEEVSSLTARNIDSKKMTIAVQKNMDFKLNPADLSNGLISVFHLQSRKNAVDKNELLRELKKFKAGECIDDKGDYITYQKMAYLLPQVPSSFFNKTNLKDPKYVAATSQDAIDLPPKLSPNNVRIKKSLPISILGTIEIESYSLYTEQKQQDTSKPILTINVKQVDEVNTGIVNAISQFEFYPIEDNSGTLIVMKAATTLDLNSLGFFKRKAIENLSFSLIKGSLLDYVIKDLGKTQDYYKSLEPR